jgi:hypothetical protein
VPGSTVGRRDPARDPTGLTPVVAARAPAVHHGGRALYDPPVSVEPHIRKVRPDDLEEVWRVHVVSKEMKKVTPRTKIVTMPYFGSFAP